MTIRSLRFSSLFLVSALACQLASSATIYVATTGLDSNDGSIGSPKLTLAGAYAISTNNDVISVAPGAYAGGVNLGKPITLLSQNGPLTTIITNAGTGNGIAISSTGVRVEGFTISNATYGVYCSGSSATPSKIVRCIIRNNSSHGVYIAGNKLVLQVFSSLIIRNGGTGYYALNVDNATPPAIILHSTIAYNTGNGYYDNHYWNCISYIANSIIANNNGIGINRASAGNANAIYLTSNLIANNAGGDFYSPNESHSMVFSGVTLTANPLFSNVSSDDFTLSSSSPALKHAGAPIVSYNSVNYTSDYDLVGTAYSLTGPNDVGCYASASAAPAKSAIVFVNGNAGSAGDGTESTPYKSLGDGLAFTAAGGTCRVANATYTNTYFVGNSQTVLGESLNDTRFNSEWYSLFVAGTNSRVQNATFGARLVAVQVNGNKSTLAQDNMVRGKYGVIMKGQPLVMDRVAVSNMTEHGVSSSSPYDDGTWNPWLKMMSCLVVSNKTGLYMNWDYGGKGAIYLYSTTIARNSADGFYRSHYATHTYAYNTIIAFNGGAGYSVNTWGNGTDYMYNSCIFGNTLGNTVRNGGSLVFNAAMVTADPKFLAGTYRLGTNSLCLQAGMNVLANGVTNDLDGTAWSLPYDIGCYDSPLTPPIKVTHTYADSVNGLDGNDGTNAATPKRLIADALGITLTNGTCHVAAGTYNESFSIPDTISVIGTNTALTRIQSIGGYTVSISSGSVVRALSIYGGTRGINSASDNNLITDCVIDGASGDGVVIYGRNTILTNSIIRNHGGVGVNCPGSTGLRQTLISTCVISNNNSHGVTCSGNPSAFVYTENSLVAGNRGSGLYISGDGSLTGTNGVFFCTVVNNSQHGVIFDYVYGLRHEVYNSIIASNGMNGVIRSGNSGQTYMGGVLVARNRLSDLALGAEAGRLNWSIVYPLLQHSPDVQADFVPGAASSALGAACPAFRPTPALDLAGNPRPATGADLGCYQTGQAVPSITRYAATFANPTRPDNSGDGLSWENAKRDTAEALAITADGGTCSLAAGVYSNIWILPANVTLQGAGLTNTVRISSGSEAGIFIPSFASNCTLRAVGARGGTSGIIVEGSNAVVRECRANAVNHFGIVNRGAPRMLVTECVVEDAGQDGLYSIGGVYRGMIVSRSLFARNNKGINLGDLRINPTIENCIAVSNRSDGIYANPDNVFVATNLIQHNTLVGNAGSGLSLDFYNNQRGSVLNNLIYGNKAYGLRISGAANAIISHGANLSYGNTNANVSLTVSTFVQLAPNLTVDPLPLRADFAPEKNSPAYNTAYLSPLDVDFYGRSRPLRGVSDIGAVENNQVTGTLIIVN